MVDESSVQPDPQQCFFRAKLASSTFSVATEMIAIKYKRRRKGSTFSVAMEMMMIHSRLLFARTHAGFKP
jgi:hypothetical protein